MRAMPSTMSRGQAPPAWRIGCALHVPRVRVHGVRGDQPGHSRALLDEPKVQRWRNLASSLLPRRLMAHGNRNCENLRPAFTACRCTSAAESSQPFSCRNCKNARVDTRCVPAHPSWCAKSNPALLRAGLTPDGRAAANIDDQASMIEPPYCATAASCVNSRRGSCNACATSRRSNGSA